MVLLIYRPGSVAPNELFFKELTSYLAVLVLYKCQVIVTGDFNIHMERSTSADVIKLQNIIDSFDCTQHVSLTPTHRYGGTLDLVLTKSEQDLDDVNVNVPNILSDHSLISWRLQLTHQPPIIADREVAGSEWTKTSSGRHCFSLSFANRISIQIPLRITSMFTTTLFSLLQTSLRRCSDSPYDVSNSRFGWTSSALLYVESLECWNEDIGEHKSPRIN